MTWYNASWSHRKPVTLTGGASGAQTDYQIKFDVTYDSDMKSDFSDLRFTKSDGTTLLNAWIEDYTTSTSAVVWVKTDTPANTVDADIYMYYGNSEASSAWNGSNTFLFFDDFSTSTAWIVGSGASIAGGIATLSGNGNYASIRATYVTPDNTVSTARVRLANANCREYFIPFSESTPTAGAVTGMHYDIPLKSLKDYRLREDAVDVVSGGDGSGVSTAVWHTQELIKSGTTWIMNLDDVEEDSTTRSYTASHPYYSIYAFNSASVGDVDVDYTYVREYVVTPATYAFGDEQIEWYDSDWLKRKTVTLTGGSDGAQTDYQVKLTVTWDSDMQADFLDLRFTKADNVTLLDCWMEDYTASTSATVWIKTDTPANTIESIIYMYYGNSGVSSAWDISATMVYGDDFEGGNLNKWTKPTGSPAIVSNPDGDGNVLYLYASGGTEEVNSTGVTLAKPFVLEYNVRVNPNTDSFIGGVSSAPWAGGNPQVIAAGHPNIGNWGYYRGGYTNTGHNFSVDTWYKIIHTRKDSAFDVTEDGTLIVNNVSDTNTQILCLFRSSTNDQAWIDNVFVRKYAANPATYAFGDEVAEWYDTDWSKRRAITLTGGASGAQTDYQVKLTITYDSDMQADFSDLRFTKADNVTLLDCWMEDHTASTSATVWVETDTPANTIESIIYMYYGNSGVSEVWSGPNTFEFFDGFEGTNGEYPSGWTGTSATYFQYSTTQSHTGSTSGRLRSTTTRYNEYRNIAMGTDSYALGYFAYMPSGGDYEHRMIVRDDTADNRMCYSHMREVTGLYTLQNGTSVTRAYTALQWEHVELIPNFSTHKVTAWLNDVSVGTVDFTSTSATLDRLWLIGDIADQGIGYVDDIYVRKYAASPATYAVGDEESGDVVVITGNAVWYYQLLIRRNS